MSDAAPREPTGPSSAGDRTVDWLARARRVSWIRRPTELGTAPRWFPGASLNSCYNALDRHVVRGHGDAPALVVEAAGDRSEWTFAELLERTAAFAGALRGFGVRPGDRVLVHLPTSAQAAVAMLACARIGGVHVLVAPDVDPGTLATTLDDHRPVVVVTTADAGPLSVLDRALSSSRHQPGAVVRQGRPAPVGAHEDPRDVDWDTVLRAGATDPAGSLEVAATDPLYVLSGAGEAGTVRDNGAHAVAAAWVVAQVLDGHSASVWWATSPLPAGAGQLLSLYAPLVGGLTTVLHDTPGRAPTMEDLWSAVSRHGVDVVLTTADVVRSWRDGGSEPGAARPLRVLAVVDGPLDPGTLRWAGEQLAERVLATSGEAAVPEDPFLASYGVPTLTESSRVRPG